MCEVDWEETYGIVLAACDHLANDRPKEASMLVSMFLREHELAGTDATCVYTKMISAGMRIVLDSLGEIAPARLDQMTLAFGMQRT